MTLLDSLTTIAGTVFTLAIYEFLKEKIKKRFVSIEKLVKKKIKKKNLDLYF